MPVYLCFPILDLGSIMPRTASRSVLLLLTVAIWGMGCQSARVISKDESGGVISIPANTDAWPFRYRSKANELLAQHCPEGYVIEREEEVITGQRTIVEQDEQNRTQQISKRTSLSMGNTTTTETTSDVTEWRIHYRKKTAEDDRESSVHAASLEIEEGSGTGVEGADSSDVTEN